MTEPDTVARALDASNAWNALGSVIEDAPLARFVRSDRFAGVPSANRVSHIRASSPRAIDQVLGEVGRAFPAGAAITFDVDHRTPPPFEARLALEGYRRRDSLLMLLEGPLRADASSCDIRPVADGATWRDWEELSIADNLGYPVRAGVAADHDDAAALTAIRRAKCPPVRYLLAYADGAPAGFFSAWEGIDGIGVTENLSVHEPFRRHGIATGLMRRCVEDARARGAGPIALTCNPDDWPKTWYARLGFKPIGMARIYARELPAPPTSNIEPPTSPA